MAHLCQCRFDSLEFFRLRWHICAKVAIDPVMLVRQKFTFESKDFRPDGRAVTELSYFIAPGLASVYYFLAAPLLS
jgi:hypothetical protein